MGTILDYLKEYGDYTFEERPLSEVDSLVLCQFSYLKFDGMVPGIREKDHFVTMQELAEHADYDSLYADERYRQDNTALFRGMLSASRFNTLQIMYYVNQIDTKKEMQFSAVTFRLSNGGYYVAFRGTDETIVGWKEDLNLAFSNPTPGQLMSVEYLEQVAEHISDHFYVGGHSKGGNLATYASMFAEKQVRDRIMKVFDHDGPGFRPEIKQKGAYGEIEDRISKTIPHSSLVGMLLYSNGKYQVVESKSIGLAQHNPYTWIVKDGEFHKVNQLYAGRRFIDETMNQWILSLSQEQVHTFVDTLYEVVLSSETDNLIDFTANGFKSIQRITAALKAIDEESARAILQIMRALFDMASINAREIVKSKKESDRGKFEEGILQLEQLFKK